MAEHAQNAYERFSPISAQSVRKLKRGIRYLMILNGTVLSCKNFRREPESLFPFYGPGYESVRLARRHKYFILVLQTERRKVDEETVLVRHRH